MVKKISFGKVDGYHNGRKTCEVVLEFGFREFEGQAPYFTVCGNLWNNRHTDIIRGGQCIDSLAEEFTGFQKNRTYCEIRDLWSKYHLKKREDIPAEDIARIEAILARF